ncbi:PadR family transcriptional regulator [Chondrinema litorale]|uniref:PadR family transcriptional regulator n=1 Tax=Chondrinema litorale TaxID=2994555 RepID=UPI002543C166|nr:PadR family transcriptional regulator [Chondrinema litorale]UZR99911.1 PadR family transcriptional regulator [Chondrinema litorale]
MKGTHLGEFEEIVLLTVGILYEDAYGLAITDEIENRTGRSITISSVHKALNRLEAKGFLTSQMGGATEERGGRQKRLFTLTTYGKNALNEARELRNSMYSAIPKMLWQQG